MVLSLYPQASDAAIYAVSGKSSAKCSDRYLKKNVGNLILLFYSAKKVNSDVMRKKYPS